MAFLTSRSAPAFRVCAGVDLGAGQATLVSARRVRGRVETQAAAERLDAQPVATAIPIHSSFLRKLRAPFASPAKAAKVWPSLLDIQLPFPLDTAVYQFLAPARTADGQVETWAVAVRREDLEQWRSACVQQGLEPWVVDHEGLALWSQSLVEQPLEKQGLRLVCYVGSERSALVWGRGGELLAVSGLRLGARDFFQGAEGEQARRSWVQRVAAFLRAQGVGPETAFQWAWCGPGVSRPDQVELLRSGGERPAASVSFTHREPAAFLARAVAARAVRADSLPCSLLPEDLAPAGLQHLQRQQERRPAWMLIAVSLLLLAVHLGWTFWMGQQRDGLQRILQERCAALAGTSALPRGQEVLVAERALKDRTSAYAPFRAALEPSRLALIQDLVVQAAERGITFESLQLNARSLVAQGATREWEQGEKLAAQLVRPGLAAEAHRRSAGPDGRILFTLKASL